MLKRPYCSPVTNGAVAPFTVPNPANTIPAGVNYRVTVTDSNTGMEVLRYTQVAFSGGSFNFDNYSPTNAGQFSPLTGTTTNGNLSVNGGLSVTGSVTFSCTQNYENIRNADCFPGADWCAKVMAADSDLGATAGEIWMNQSAGTSACAATLALSANHILRFVQGGSFALTSGGGNGIALNNYSGVLGPSFGSLTLTYAGSGTAIAPQSTAALTSKVKLHDFMLAGSSAGAIGIDLNNATYWDTTNVWVQGFTRTGAIGIRRYASGGLNGSYYDHFENVDSQSNYDDWTWDTDAGTTAYPPNRDTCIDCQGDNSTRYSFNINAGGTQSFYHCKVEGAGVIALLVNSSDNNFTDCSLENAGAVGTGLQYQSNNASRNFFSGSVSTGFATQIVDNTTGSSGLNENRYNGGFSPLAVTDHTNLPQGASAYLFMGGNYPNSVLGKIYIGAGGGWMLGFSKRSGGVDTDEWFMRDDGSLEGVETATAPMGGVGVAGRDLLWPDVTAHRWKMNNNNGGMDNVGDLLLYNASGTPQLAPHTVVGTCTLGTNCSVTLTGSAIFTSASSYVCIAQDQTGIFATKVTQTGNNSFTITGNATDVIGYSCTGN